MADNVTEQYERTNVYEICEWYNFSNEAKRLLPIIIHNTQATVVVSGFGNIVCTREQFKKVSTGNKRHFPQLSTLREVWK